MDYITISQYLNSCNFQEKLWIREESILVTVTLRAVQHLHSMKFGNQEEIVPSLSSDQPPGDLMQIQHVMSHVISSQMIMSVDNSVTFLRRFLLIFWTIFLPVIFCENLKGVQSSKAIKADPVPPSPSDHIFHQRSQVNFNLRHLFWSHSHKKYIFSAFGSWSFNHGLQAVSMFFAEAIKCGLAFQLCI